MIKNIIFDMGGVLIRWDPEGFVRELGLNAEDSALLMQHTYGCEMWGLMDWGKYSEQDVYENACAHLPERLHRYAERLVHHWCDDPEPIAGMRDFAADCKFAGKKIYLLSNASFKQKLYWPKIPGHELFDGRIVSAEVSAAKPDRRIYEILLETYGLKAEECLFIDDMWYNVLGAIQAGLHAIVFDGDMDRLRRIVSYFN